MEYFAGLDVSMAETQICVMGRNGAVIHKAKVPSTPADIAAELAQLPTCRRIVFETGRMAPMLYHGLRQLGLPVICVESRQAYQALKLLATHKTDHNDARGLAHLARTGFFKPVHVKSLPAHAVRALSSHARSWSASESRSKIRSADWRWRSGSDCLAASVPALPRGRWPPAMEFLASMARCGDCSPHAMLS